MRSLASLSAVLFLGVVAACGAESDEAAPAPQTTPHVFVGRVSGSKALVAIVESEETVIAYTCGQGDDRLTHTGWYFGVKQGVPGDNVQLVNGPAGLAIRASLGSGGGSGVLKLADGVERAFTVEPARGDAGLFDYEDAAQFVGFIRTNDGDTAGSTTLRLSGIGTASEPNTTTSAPVTAVTTISTTSPTTTGPLTPITTQPVVAGSVTVITTPVVTADRRIITRSGPVVVFMMHGMADNLGMAPANAKDDFVECAGPKDTPFYGRCEWGQDVIPGIFGSANVRAQLTALDGSDATGDQFIRAMENVRGADLPDENLGHRLDNDCVADPEKAEVVDGKFARHFVVPGALRSASQLSLASIGRTPVPPKLAAFVTWRDPTRGLVFSGRRVTRQIYAALRWYEKTYRVTPGVILLAQSFGGLASRFMLSNPDPRTLTAETNQEGVRLCREDLAKMEYVRDRTLFLTTLATPHEGSYLAEWGPPVKDALRAALGELRNGTASSPLAKVLRGMDTISTLLLPSQRPTVTDSLVDSIDGFLPQLESAPALKEMTLARMATHNRTTISPERARRTAASPIVGAGRSLVPIYVTLSRSPGSDVFDGPDLVKGFRELSRKRAKVRGWILQTMLVSDVLTRQLVPNGFGSVNVAPYAEHRAILDRRARLFDSSPTTTQLEQKFSSDVRTVISTVSPWFLGKFGRNADAVITGLLDTQVNVTLPHFMAPIHTSQRWRIGFDGRTAEVPIPAFECGGRRIEIDLDALARLLVNRFGTTPSVLDAIRGRDLRAILELLTVAIQNTDAFAKGAAEWFVGKIQEQIAIGPLPAECNALPDNAFDVFSLAELANWKAVDATGRIPVPSFIGTGEPVSDGEMDTDGAVHSASALGFTLGRVPFFFEHDRLDDAGAIGSWYRLYDNPVTEKYNHGQLYENEVGRWFRDTFLAAQVGPVPARDSFSVWVE